MLVALSIAAWLLGLCVGSFLNVVVYRLPRGLSVASPRRSFCPNCDRPIRARDNIPVVSWLLLAGRCRYCAKPISVQYPLIESLTGMLFVVVFRLVVGDGGGASGAPPRIDYAVLAAWLVFTSAMVACSAMDILSYSIHAAVTDVSIVVGVVLLACATPAAHTRAAAGAPLSAGAAAAAVVGLAVSYASRRGVSAAADEPEPPAGDRAAGEQRDDAPGATRALRLSAQAGMAISVVLALAWIATGVVPRSPASLLAPLSIATVFVAIVVAGGQRRESDEQLREAIEREAPHARRTAVRELVGLAPAIGAGLLACCAVAYWTPAGAAWRWLVGFQLGSLEPAAGALLAVRGAVVAAAAGWALRIVFTLVFGREAFGTGDIFILAAAGACTGWEIAILGLGLSIALALLGWTIGLVMKSTEMIPFGPWLALGFLAALWLRRPAGELVGDYVEGLASTWERAPNLVFVMAGVLLVGGVGAVVAARLLRRWIERRVEHG